MAKYLRFQMAHGEEFYQDVKMDSTIMLFAKTNTRTFFIDENGNPNGYVCYELNQADNTGADSVIPYLHKELKTLMELDNDSPTQDKAIYRTIPYKIPIAAKTVECTANTWVEWTVNGLFSGSTLNGVNITDPLGNPMPDVGQVVLGSAITPEAGIGFLGILDNSPCAVSTNLDVAFIKNATGTTSAGTAVPLMTDYYYVGKTFSSPEGDDGDDSGGDGATWHIASKKVFTTTEFTGRIVYGKTNIDSI
tara:strand:+ start:2318 stop:3064 length:747 start_codon:yes stop_codon:yes gene_type:complete